MLCGRFLGLKLPPVLCKEIYSVTLRILEIMRENFSTGNSDFLIEIFRYNISIYFFFITNPNHSEMRDILPLPSLCSGVAD